VPLNPDSQLAIQSELGPNERLLWSDQPKQGFSLHREDVFLIPFSLLWGGFAIFWEAGVMGLWTNGPRSGPVSSFMMLWGVPFVLIGQYFIWGRFIYGSWKKRRTFYGVTDRRVIVVQNAWSRQVASAYINTLPTIIKETGRNGSGTLRFAQQVSPWAGARGWGAWDGMSVGTVPTFVDIENLDSVYRLVSDLRDKTQNRSLAGQRS
jgi:hypothetical protein